MFLRKKKGNLVKFRLEDLRPLTLKEEMLKELGIEESWNELENNVSDKGSLIIFSISKELGGCAQKNHNLNYCSSLLHQKGTIRWSLIGFIWENLPVMEEMNLPIDSDKRSEMQRLQHVLCL